ncbi:UNVERIFIED_CONTAM: hypothetical protein Sangu_2808600 [Sesamum angustifolium]|uniref:Uncharacterized protein n=1 Tax=Sesamum angustifolium TaxID=2727405 RepID=A0AAW2ITV7_9LAMI
MVEPWAGWTLGQSFVLIKRLRLSKQLSTWLWEVLAMLAPRKQLKDIYLPSVEGQ